MSDLIKAFQIFLKYGDIPYPTNCDHDLLWVNVDPERVSQEDKDELDKLGFFVGTEFSEGFTSFKYGSC